MHRRTGRYRRSKQKIDDMLKRSLGLNVRPLHYRGLECFQLGNADLHWTENLGRLSWALDFTFDRLCMKLLKTGSIDVVKDCQSYFAIDLPSCGLKRRQDKFIVRDISTVNGLLPIL